MYLSDYIRPDCATKLCYTSYGCRWGCWWWFVFGGGVGVLWREFGLRKNLISFATQYCIKNQHGITKWHNFVTRWYCPVVSRKMPTLAKIINLSKWIFFIVKVQIIIYIFLNFYAHNISRYSVRGKYTIICASHCTWIWPIDQFWGFYPLIIMLLLHEPQ